MFVNVGLMLKLINGYWDYRLVTVWASDVLNGIIEVKKILGDKEHKIVSAEKSYYQEICAAPTK